MTAINSRSMLRIHKANKTFNANSVNEVKPLQQISLDIEEGSFVILLGGNGSGKSTLLNAIAGSFQLDSGSITLADQEISQWPEHKRASMIGRVFQNPFSGTAPTMSIAENFALASKRGHFRGLSLACSRHRNDELRERISSLKMGLENRLDTAIGSLSGGQRQALTLLMATWIKPKLLLLDEHTAALDPKSAEQVIELTQKIVNEHGLTTLMVTHSMQQALNLGDRLIMMNRGNISFDCPAKQKSQLKVDDLLAKFEMISRQDLLDESVATLLSQTYL